MTGIDQYRTLFIDYLNSSIKDKEPKNLYEPIHYILQLGGKRLRPILTILTADIFGNKGKTALDAALAVEIFHNFSLVHDDIMDEAPLRRGKATVHEKWNLNTGILSGDAMLILAYQLFENYDNSTFKTLAQIFSKTALEVCEGQQFDIDFETRNDVSENEYIKMIEFKTAVLVGAAMKMGAVIANASEEDCHNIYEFGRLLGIAFQLQDDYLDAFGDPKTFGKQVGGDIIENKKTYLYIKALEHANEEDGVTLTQLFTKKIDDNISKIETTKTIFDRSGASELTRNAIKSYTEQAFSKLNSINIDDSKKMILKALGTNLMNRTV